jgi:hypothetical protein
MISLLVSGGVLGAVAAVYGLIAAAFAGYLNAENPVHRHRRLTQRPQLPASADIRLEAAMHRQDTLYYTHFDLICIPPSDCGAKLQNLILWFSDALAHH